MYSFCYLVVSNNITSYPLQMACNSIGEISNVIFICSSLQIFLFLEYLHFDFFREVFSSFFCCRLIVIAKIHRLFASLEYFFGSVWQKKVILFKSIGVCMVWQSNRQTMKLNYLPCLKFLRLNSEDSGIPCVENRTVYLKSFGFSEVTC